MAILFQAISTGIAGYLCMSMGIIFTWPSSTLRLFASANTTLNRPMTETEVALLGSLSSISALISIPCVSYVIEAIGKKYCCMLFSVLQVITWIIITACHKVEAILAAIFLSGLSSGVLMVVPIYVSEICQDSIRGRMTSGAMVFYHIGMLVSYLMGGYLKYDNMNYVCLSITVLEVVLISFLKESPMHLMRKGHEKEAAQAIAFYRGMSINSKLVKEELQVLRKALNPDLCDITSEAEKLKSKSDFKSKENSKVSWWQFLKKSRSTRRALFVIVVLYTTVIFQGLIVAQVYAEPLFAEAVPSMSSTICSVIFTLVTITSGFVGAFLIERAGRRLLMIYASLCTGVCCVILGTQIQLQWGPHWVTVMFMYIFSLTYTCGAGTVPCVLVAEIFLPEIKSIASMLVMEWFLVCSFIVLFIYNPLVATIGLGPVFYFFAVACFLSFIFCNFFLPETKGLTVDVIQTLFARRIVCRRYIMVDTEIYMSTASLKGSAVLEKSILRNVGSGAAADSAKSP